MYMYIYVVFIHRRLEYDGTPVEDGYHLSLLPCDAEEYIAPTDDVSEDEEEEEEEVQSYDTSDYENNDIITHHYRYDEVSNGNSTQDKDTAADTSHAYHVLTDQEYADMYNYYNSLVEEDMDKEGYTDSSNNDSEEEENDSEEKEENGSYNEALYTSYYNNLKLHKQQQQQHQLPVTPTKIQSDNSNGYNSKLPPVINTNINDVNSNSNNGNTGNNSTSSTNYSTSPMNNNNYNNNNANDSMHSPLDAALLKRKQRTAAANVASHVSDDNHGTQGTTSAYTTSFI